MPLNPERVLAGPKPRPKVLSLVSQLSAERFEAIRLVPGTVRYAAQRRAAVPSGAQVKARVYCKRRDDRFTTSATYCSSFRRPKNPRPVSRCLCRKC